LERGKNNSAKGRGAGLSPKKKNRRELVGGKEKKKKEEESFGGRKNITVTSSEGRGQIEKGGDFRPRGAGPVNNEKGDYEAKGQGLLLLCRSEEGGKSPQEGEDVDPTKEKIHGIALGKKGASMRGGKREPQCFSRIKKRGKNRWHDFSELSREKGSKLRWGGGGTGKDFKKEGKKTIFGR